MAAPLRETDLYEPVKRLLEGQGYEVKAEVGAADVVGLRGEELPVAVTAAELRELQALVREVLCGSHLVRFVAELLLATHPDASGEAETQRFVRFGASARAGQAIILGAKARALLDGRPAVAREDIDACLLPALGHRVLLGFEAEAERIEVASLLPRWIETAQQRAR